VVNNKCIYLAIVILGLSVSLPSQAIDSAKELRQARLSPLSQGRSLYKTYCQLCHGETGSGDGLAAPLYTNRKLNLSNYQSDHLDRDITNGVGEFMPPFVDELSNKQIAYVAHYVKLVADPVSRGKAIFLQYCTLCHGVRGDGKGRASKVHNPPPANLTISDKNDDYKRLIITYGGGYMGRNPAMPVWGTELSEQAINDVIKYTNSIRIAPLEDIINKQ